MTPGMAITRPRLFAPLTLKAALDSNPPIIELPKAVGRGKSVEGSRVKRQPRPQQQRELIRTHSVFDQPQLRLGHQERVKYFATGLLKNA